MMNAWSDAKGGNLLLERTRSLGKGILPPTAEREKRTEKNSDLRSWEVVGMAESRAALRNVLPAGLKWGPLPA